jgi:hypothetical protein
MASEKNKIKALQEFSKAIQSGEGPSAAIGKLLVYSMYPNKLKSSVVDVTVPKRKYASIGTSQMRSGRSSTIQTSSTGLMSKASIGKKTLLGG